MPDMSYNTPDGQPPMSMMPQSQTITVPTAILNHPAVQAGVQQATQDYAKQASAMPTGQPDISMATDFGKKMIGNLMAMKNAGLMSTPYQENMQKHPILGGLANAAMAFGQGVTKQPFFTDFQAQQNALLQSRMQNASEMARMGQLTPEQMIMMGFKQESIANTQAQRDQSNWSQFINKINPATASSRSTLGMTANGNMRANRALATVQNNPVMTYQDLGNVVGDLAGIYQGGAPTDMGMKHQQYDSIQSRIANMQQFLTGKPQDAVPQAIKDKIIGTIQSLKNVNNQALKSNLDSMEKAQRGLIAKHPDEWSEFRKGVENDYINSGNQQQGGVSAQGVPNGSPFAVGQDYNGHKILSVKVKGQ